MPDLAHLTEEERQIIETVLQRQREEEEKEQEILRWGYIEGPEPKDYREMHRHFCVAIVARTGQLYMNRVPE